MNISDWCKAGPSRATNENERTTLTRDESMGENDNWSEMGMDQREHSHVDFDVSFSSRDGSRMEDDSIKSFSESEVYMDKAFVEDGVEDSQQTQLTSTENILSGLDRWHPTKNIRSPSPILSIQDQLVDDILSDNDDHSWPSPIHSIHNESMEQQQQQPPSQVQNESFHMPDAPVFKTVTPTISQDMDTTTHLKFTTRLKKESMGFKPMENFLQACKEHSLWLRQTREKAVKKGSVASLCASSEDAQLFRIIRIWKDQGFIFACCTRLSQDETNYVVSTSLAQGNNNPALAHPEDDLVEEPYSQPMQLPPYSPSDDDEQLIFMFSFVYMHAPMSTRDKLLQDECVAIWPPWTHKSLGDKDIYIVTRFMSQSIY